MRTWFRTPDTGQRLTEGLQRLLSGLQEWFKESQNQIQVLKQEVARARTDALVDGLTGLANRRAFDQCQDTAAHIGGEEFAIVLPSTPLNGAFVVAEKIRTAIGSSRIRRGQQALAERATVSPGVACLRPYETATTRAHSTLRNKSRAG
ncbi:diguanylate cyclase [Aquabacterium sp.]|uniref:GGDEF domain-containing protein n=1 Tax=Aquabacterium sp. TaxID=1872578 RepID=UPI00198BA79E|nr:diguanylate cyclase [Aquabacterium sp.]MBC7702108.1 diguanylate cyclase [Aquabacterium sp.]